MAGSVAAAGAAAAAGGAVDPIGTVTRTYADVAIFFGKGDVTASAQISHITDGDLTAQYTNTSTPQPNADEWYTANPSVGIGSSYEVRVTVTAGTNPNVGGLTPGSWFRINANRIIGNTITGTTGSVTSTITLDYRVFGGPGTIIHTATGIIVSASIS